ncbi:MAG TPA: CRISPR-associated protein Csx19 [Thermoanaerobaculia bacterium]|jgi:CRISPR-associated protein (TIGR03984 family)
MSLFGGSIQSLDEDAAFNVIRDVIGETPQATTAYRWLLMHCDNGVVWGRREETAWVLSGSAFPEVSPTPSVRKIQQLRLFGSQSELLVWRTVRDPEPQFRGRVLADQETDADRAPLSEKLILIGDRLLASAGGFSLIGDATGSRHAVPLLCRADDFIADGKPRSPLQLRIRHYLAEVPARAKEGSGALRIAATRLCGIALHGKEVE